MPDVEDGPRRALPLVVAACLVATLAFWAYTRTLLSGVDLGDTGGFQASVLWWETSARRAYPLYYGLAEPFIRAVSGDNPARGLNLFSAIWAAIASGLVCVVAGRIARSPLAGAAAGLLLSFSYTFWTQAVIAEVYSLHLALMAMCLLALQAYQTRPTLGRLALFFGVYACSFGNHLGMILFVVPFAVFLLHVHPTPRELFAPRTILLGVGIAAAGALLYTPHFLFVWSSIDAPPGVSDRVSAFWLDVTKADWREQMVLGIDATHAWNRTHMWMWDARQQFGIGGVAGAVVALCVLWFRSRPWALLISASYLVVTTFALSYNVGDAHVFLLPGHLLIALTIGAGIGALSHVGVRHAVSVAVLLYAGWRGWDTWPAVDRHDDRRADAYLSRLTAGIDGRSALLVTKLDWQLENILLYSARHERPAVDWVRLDDVLLHFPFLVRDNRAESRDIVLTRDAAASVVAQYADEFPLVLDQPPATSLLEVVSEIPPGTPYVLTVLPPPGGRAIDAKDVSAALSALMGQRVPTRSEAAYEVWAGGAGEAPTFYRSSPHPFRASIRLGGEPFTIRMDSWLPDDTFRRGGFGHVLHQRTHALIVERGVSLMWLRPDGVPATMYAASLYTPEARFRIPVPDSQLARHRPYTGSDRVAGKPQ